MRYRSNRFIIIQLTTSSGLETSYVGDVLTIKAVPALALSSTIAASSFGVRAVNSVADPLTIESVSRRVVGSKHGEVILWIPFATWLPTPG
jgi:hypothetical protein